MVASRADAGLDDLIDAMRDAASDLVTSARITPVIGPRRVTFAIRPDRPAEVGALLRGADHFRHHLRTGVVEVERDDAGGVLVSVPNPRPGYLPVARLGGRGWQVPVGIDRRNRPVGIDLTLYPQALIIGPPRTGKTTLARTIVYGVARQVQPEDARLVIVTGDPADWRDVESLPHTAALLSHAQAVPMLRALRGEVQRREAAGERGPVVVVIIDDMGVVFEHDAHMGKTLLAILKQGRRVGVRFIGMAHTTSSTDLGHFEVGQVVRRRFQTQAADAWSAAMGAGRGGTNATALGVGEVVSAGDTARPYAVTVARCEPGDLEQLAGKLARKYHGFQSAPMAWLTTASNRLQPLPTVATGGCAPSPLRVMRPDEGGEPPTVATVVRLPRRLPTAEDIEVIRANLALCGGKKSRTCRETWGAKDGDTWRWLALALEGVSA